VWDIIRTFHLVRHFCLRFFKGSNSILKIQQHSCKYKIIEKKNIFTLQTRAEASLSLTASVMKL